MHTDGGRAELTHDTPVYMCMSSRAHTADELWATVPCCFPALSVLFALQRHTSGILVRGDLPHIVCLFSGQMTRRSNVRCVSDSSPPTATSLSTRRNMGTRSLPVKSVVRCSTARMLCWTTRGGTWMVSLGLEMPAF